MAGAKMVDKTNMSLDDIIKMDRKSTKGKPGFLRNKNSVARNVVKKARNSFINRKPINLTKKKAIITEKRQDVRSRLLKNKQMNNRNKIIPRNIQKSTRNSNFPRQNRLLNTNNRPRITNRINSNMINSAPAFRITTNNERYQSNNRGRPNTRATNKRMSSVNNYINPFSNSRNQNSNFSGSDRRPIDRNDNYQFSRRNIGGPIHRNPILARDREYEAMARALVEAHRESRYSISQSTSSQRRYYAPMESHGYPYRR